MPMIKKVNGSEVEMTAEDEQAFLDQQAIDSQPPTAAELDALADAVADKVMTEAKDAMRAMGLTLAEVVFRVSNGTIPQGITETQARTWIRDTFRQNYRSLL